VIRHQPAVETVGRYVADGILSGRILVTALNLLTFLSDRTAASTAVSLLDQDVQPEIRLAALTILDKPLSVWMT
jgi:hypothetical protein